MLEAEELMDTLALLNKAYKDYTRVKAPSWRKHQLNLILSCIEKLREGLKEIETTCFLHSEEVVSVPLDPLNIKITQQNLDPYEIQRLINITQNVKAFYGGLTAYAYRDQLKK